MGTDSKLFNIKSNQKIYCDRKYNLDNDYTRAKGLDCYLKNQGLPVYILRDLICELDELINTSRSAGVKTMYERILEELKLFDDYDVFILIDEHDNRY